MPFSVMKVKMKDRPDPIEEEKKQRAKRAFVFNLREPRTCLLYLPHS